MASGPRGDFHAETHGLFHFWFSSRAHWNTYLISAKFRALITTSSSVDYIVPSHLALTETPKPLTPQVQHIVELIYQMDLAEPHQAIDFPVDPFFIPYQPHNDAQQNAWVQAWVSFRHPSRDILLFTYAHSSLCLPLQVPPAPNGQPEGHQEDIPPPVRGFARLGGMQDPRNLDVAYQGVVDYHPQQLLGVSSSHLSTT